jgi:Leucine-rich repeat (LRR) protein
MSTLVAFVAAFILALGVFFYTTERVVAPTVESPGNENANPQAAVPVSTILDRSHQGLTTMPKDILAMTHIRELNLSHNNLSGALPAEIRFLQNLEVLNLSDNRMTGLPAEVGQLSKLRVLNLSNNSLTGIPHELGNLQNLEILDLSGNTISEFDLGEIKKKLPTSTRLIR